MILNCTDKYRQETWQVVPKHILQPCNETVTNRQAARQH